MNLHDQVLAMFELEAKLGGFATINNGIDWRERFALLRRNYAVKQKMVDAGLDCWFFSDPYQIADWVSLFTPIEYALWFDIRGESLALWPQLPVGRFFVDFGNPVAKVAIECDGREFHQDRAKDAARDAEMAQMGWRVFRIPGWQCKGVPPDYDPQMNREERQERERLIDERTPRLAIRRVAEILEAHMPARYA